jgi:hypothetical protein
VNTRLEFTNQQQPALNADHHQIDTKKDRHPTPPVAAALSRP